MPSFKLSNVTQHTLVAGVVKVWDTHTGQMVRDLEGPGGAIEWVTWHPKGNVVLAGSDDMTVWMWLAASGQCMQVSAPLARPSPGLRKGLLSSAACAACMTGHDEPWVPCQ